MAYIDYINSISGRILGENELQINIADVVDKLDLKDGFHITTTQNEAVAEGTSFVSGNIFEAVASNTYAVLHLKSGSKNAVLSYGVNSDGAYDYGLYINPVLTANGTELYIAKRNLVTLVANTTKVYKTPTYSSLGQVGVPRFSGVAGTPAKGGSDTGDTQVLVIPLNTSVFVAVKNTSSQATRISIIYNWFEQEVEI